MTNKKIIYVGLIVLVLAIVCVAEQIMVKNFLSSTQTAVTELSQYIAETEDISNQEVYQKVVDVETAWSGYENTLCFFVNLKDIEDFGAELTKMKVYVVENNVPEFKASLALLLYYIDGYYNIMGISFENIF